MAGGSLAEGEPVVEGYAHGRPVGRANSGSVGTHRSDASQSGASPGRGNASEPGRDPCAASTGQSTNDADQCAPGLTKPFGERLRKAANRFQRSHASGARQQGCCRGVEIYRCTYSLSNAVMVAKRSSSASVTAQRKANVIKESPAATATYCFPLSR
jgi:hypothetical protein